MLIKKEPCLRARVLDAADCPPVGLPHDPLHYPRYYDPIYYPELHARVFSNMKNCIAWLVSALKLHIQNCSKCHNAFDPIALTARCDSSSEQILISSSFTTVCLLNRELEHAHYTHCLVVKKFRRFQDPASWLRMRDENPLWVNTQSDCQQQALLSLPVSDLKMGNQLCIPRLEDPDTERRKEAYVSNIMTAFNMDKFKFTLMDHIEWSKWADSEQIPTLAKSTRSSSFAYYLDIQYSKSISTVLQEPPYIIKEPYQDTLILDYCQVNSWANDDIEQLTKRIEYAFSPSELQNLIKQIPIYRRPTSGGRSRKKRANALIYHILCRLCYLCTLDVHTLYQHMLGIQPSTFDLSMTDFEVINEILHYEYGKNIMDALQVEQLTKSERKKLERHELKQERVTNSKKQLEDLKENWPQIVPKDVIYQCLNAYREGTIWKTPAVCAVCAQHSENIETILLTEDVTTKYNLELLRIQDEWMLEKCIDPTTGLSDFANDHKTLQNLMIDKAGIHVDKKAGTTFDLCAECHSSLTRKRIPRFSLANRIYRGKLPLQFSDMTWVEEMVCALYRNTAQITRLYGSSDPAQPTVLHGNTCAHDMNLVSTASILPRTPTDINGMLSVVFIGCGKLNMSSLKNMFRVRKYKIWNFLCWLKANNQLYSHIPIDINIVNMYPEDGTLPGLQEAIIYNHEIDPDIVFNEETAGFGAHPAAVFRQNQQASSNENICHEVMLEKMGVSDPESEKCPGRTYTASALRNLVKDMCSESTLPDMTIHHGAQAISEYDNPALFPGMFPTLFPYGIGGFDDKARPTPLSFQQQAQYYFNIPDRSFRYHYSYMFVAVNMWQRRLSHLHTSIAVKSNRFATVARKLVQVSSQALADLASVLEREQTCKDMTSEQKDAFELLKQTNLIAARIPGSQAAKLFSRNEIRSYFGHIGLPHIYLTFNPPAAHSPIFQVMFGDSSVDLNLRFPKMPDSKERALRLAKDPVAAADFFEFCVKAAFCHLLGWDYEKHCTSQRGGILGALRAFYGTVELTERGSFHGHFLIWLVGGLNPSDLHKKLKTNPDYEKQFFQFFESIIHHHLPDVEMNVDSSEPRVERPPIPPKYTASDPIEILNEWEEVYVTEVKKCGEVLQRHVCKPVCHKYGNEGKCRFLFPHEVVEASYFDPETNSVVLLCRDPNINYFNPYILIFCRHNHDIKCILSGKGAKAAMFYITDYITKMDLKTYQSLTLLSRAVSHMPDVSDSKPLDAAKTLIHKCLSQFTKQQQIHAQQAVRYLRGLGDTISSHKTIPMLSSLLLAWVTKYYDPANTQEIEGMNCATEDDDECEQTSLKIKVNHDGELIEAHQIHDYWYRSDSLADMCFYDFCRCTRLEAKSKSSKLKNTYETRIGVLRRHELKRPHPLADTHVLIEHTNNDRGDLQNELIPRVVGMSIPRDTSPNWSKFALAHLKPFSVSAPLLTENMTWDLEHATFQYTDEHKQIMMNWNAVHECEDERDADRLCKHDAATAASKAMTLAVLDQDESDENYNIKTAGAQRNFHAQQFVSLLQQSGYIKMFRSVDVTQKASENHCNLKLDASVNATELKKWAAEIKAQEKVVSMKRRNPASKSIQHIGIESSVQDSELDPSVYASDKDVDYDVPDTEAPYVLSNSDLALQPDFDPENVLNQVQSQYKLNERQTWSFKIIARNFLDVCVFKKPDAKPLRMLMTGPGGTGKTHVVRAVKEVMTYYGAAHQIRFLAPTGSAASLIDGMTIHKGLGIKIVKNDGRGKGGRLLGESKEDASILVSIQNKTALREEWQDVQVLLLDECSLASGQIICEVDQALRYAKERPDEWFGGIIMIFAGDFFQYPPVMGASLCAPISLYGKQSDEEYKKRFGRLAWKSIDTVIELVEQHRMKSDPDYAAAVLRLRTRESTLDDVDLFNSCLIKSASNPQGIDMSSSENERGVVLVQTNSMRQTINMMKAKSTCTSQDLLMCAANDKIDHKITLSGDEYQKLLHLDFASAKFQRSLPGFLPLYIGMPVILRTKNLSTDLKITNGSQGIIRQLVTEILPQGITSCKCALVEFPDSPLQLSGLPKGVFPITPSTFSFTTSIQRGKDSIKIKVIRHQLPIQPAFAVTGHSAQGKSLPKIIASLHEGGFGAYVAASRALNREGLCITHRVQLQDLKKPLGHDLYRENLRLKALEHNTYVRFGFIDDKLMAVPDPETETNLNITVKARYVELGKRQRDMTETNIQAESNAVKRLKTETIPPESHKSTQRVENPISSDDSSGLFSRENSPYSNTSISSIEDYDSSFEEDNGLLPFFPSGCQWSAINYSCSYDAVFMSLHSIYRNLNQSQKNYMKEKLNSYSGLGDSLELLSQPTMQQTKHFNSLRDKLRDYLSAYSQDFFPRYGANGASAPHILDILLPRSERQLRIHGSCSCMPFKQSLNIDTHLPNVLVPFPSERYQDPLSAHIDLQEHLQILLSDTSEPFKHPENFCQSCGREFDVLVPILTTSPLICLEVQERVDEKPIVPSLKIQLASESDTPCTYSLSAVIYLGGFHFTCRLFVQNKVFKYDGRLANGRPILEMPSTPDLASDLLKLDNRSAVAFLYTAALA